MPGELASRLTSARAHGGRAVGHRPALTRGSIGRGRRHTGLVCAGLWCGRARPAMQSSRAAHPCALTSGRWMEGVCDSRHRCVWSGVRLRCSCTRAHNLEPRSCGWCSSPAACTPARLLAWLEWHTTAGLPARQAVMCVVWPTAMSCMPSPVGRVLEAVCCTAGRVGCVVGCYEVRAPHDGWDVVSAVGRGSLGRHRAPGCVPPQRPVAALVPVLRRCPHLSLASSLAQPAHDSPHTYTTVGAPPVCACVTVTARACDGCARHMSERACCANSQACAWGAPP